MSICLVLGFSGHHFLRKTRFNGLQSEICFASIIKKPRLVLLLLIFLSSYTCFLLVLLFLRIFKKHGHKQIEEALKVFTNFYASKLVEFTNLLLLLYYKDKVTHMKYDLTSSGTIVDQQVEGICKIKIPLYKPTKLRSLFTARCITRIPIHLLLITNYDKDCNMFVSFKLLLLKNQECAVRAYHSLLLS